MTTRTDVREEKITEPAKRWVNRWQIACRCSVSPIGTIYDGNVVWPSKEIAEQKAIQSTAAHIAKGWCPAKHLGAFPVEAS